MQGQRARLEVTVVGARGLKPKSYCYCTCEVQLKPETKVQTETVESSSSLIWNHLGEIAEYTPNDDIEFSLFSQDAKGGYEKLGKTALSQDRFYPGGFDGELALGKGNAITIEVKVRVFLLGRIAVTIVGASGLQSADKSFRPNSYCVCEVPGKALFCKTLSIPESSSPMWNHMHEFDNYSAGDSFELSVWNRDISGDDLLGVAAISYKQFAAGDFEGLVPLRKNGKAIEAELMVEVKHIQRGTPAPTKLSARLEVLIIGASTNGITRKLDPYCMCELQGVESLRFQTPVAKNTSSPNWNHLHEVPEYTPEAPLRLDLFHYTGPGSDDLLGSSILSYKQFYPDGFDGKVELKDAKEQVKATLSLRIRLFLKSLIEVTIVRADGLRKLESFGFVDSYCVCEVAANRDLNFQTRSIKERSSPVWNHTQELMNYAAGSPLQFSVWDKLPSAGGDDLLGVAMLMPSHLEGGAFGGPLQLSKARKNLEATLTIKVKTLQAGTPEVGKIPMRVSVINAQDLRQDRSRELTHVYCTCEILGKRGESYKTVAVANSLSPAWNESYDFTEYLLGDFFLFSVWGKTRNGEVLLGKSLVMHESFHPNGFAGKVMLELDMQKDMGCLILKIASLKNTPKRKTNAAEVSVGGRPPQQRFLAQLKRDALESSWGLSLTGPYLCIGGVSPNSPAASWRNSDGQGLRSGDVVLQINGKAGGTAAGSCELSRQRQFLDLLVERAKMKDAETQIDPSLLGNCDVGVQAAGKLLEIGEAHFAAELPLAAVHMQSQREQRQNEREETLRLEVDLLQKENARVKADIQVLQREMESERRKAEEKMSRQEEALKRYRLAQQSRQSRPYAMEPVADMIMGSVQPHPAQVVKAPTLPRKVPYGVEQDDMAFSGRYAPCDASEVDLRREVLRLEGRLIELRRSKAPANNASETASSLPNDLQSAQSSKSKAVFFPGEGPPASSPKPAELPQQGTQAKATSQSELPPPVSFQEILQRLYRTQELCDIDDWESPEHIPVHDYANGMTWESAGDRLQGFYTAQEGISDDMPVLPQRREARDDDTEDY